MNFAFLIFSTVFVLFFFTSQGLVLIRFSDFFSFLPQHITEEERKKVFFLLKLMFLYEHTQCVCENGRRKLLIFSQIKIQFKCVTLSKDFQDETGPV
jgi:hypothetical protein